MVKHEFSGILYGLGGVLGQEARISEVHFHSYLYSPVSRV